MIIDTSAVIAIALAEPERDRFLRALYIAKHTAMSQVTFFESSIVLLRRTENDDLLVLNDLLHEFSVELVPVDGAQTAFAVEAYRRYGKGRHPAGLNLAIASATRSQSNGTSRCSARAATSRKPTY